MLRLRDAMQQFVEGGVVRPGTWLGGTVANQFVPLNVYGTTEELTVEALLPGVSQEDVDVNLDRRVLTITARRQGPEASEGRQWYRQEFQPGQVTRSLALPFPIEIEYAAAHFANDLLTLTLPKVEVAKPKRIAIGTGQAQPQLSSTTR